MPLVLEAVCPDGVGEGGLVAVQTADGTTVEVVVPAGVSAGDSFTIEYTPTNSAPWLEEILEALVSENFVRVLDSWCEHECHTHHERKIAFAKLHCAQSCVARYKRR